MIRCLTKTEIVGIYFGENPYPLFIQQFVCVCVCVRALFDYDRIEFRETVAVLESSRLVYWYLP